MDADPGHLAHEVGLVGAGQAVRSGGRAGVPAIVRVFGYFGDIDCYMIIIIRIV